MKGEVVEAYEIEEGDREVLRLCRKTKGYDHLILDDRLLYIIAHRFNMRPLFLRRQRGDDWGRRWREDIAGSVSPLPPGFYRILFA